MSQEKYIGMDVHQATISVADAGECAYERRCPHPASKWCPRLRLGRFRCRSYSGAIFRLVDMLANERDHVESLIVRYLFSFGQLTYGRAGAT
jgi:hypothetical protein